MHLQNGKDASLYLVTDFIDVMSPDNGIDGSESEDVEWDLSKPYDDF